MDMSLMDLINQAVLDFGTLKGLQGQALTIAIVAIIVRVLLSTMKVSVIRQKLWDKLSVEVKAIVPPALGLIAAILAIQPLTPASVLLGVTSGALAIPLHHLLKAIESLPKINASVKLVVSIAAKILGGKLPQ
jgi:hypothetical protein